MNFIGIHKFNHTFAFSNGSAYVHHVQLFLPNQYPQ